MLPYPEKKTFFAYIMKPFDMWIWILILTTLSCLVAVWHFLNKHSTLANPNSAGYFLFATITYFVGQSADFREHRPIQNTLILLMTTMTMILRNAYQSVLISLMAETRYDGQIKTIQGMIDSNLTFYADPAFMQMFNNSDQYQRLSEKTWTTLDEINFEKVASEKVGFILSCSLLDALFQNTGSLLKADTNVIDYYYKMPEKFYTFYKMIPTATYSPFAVRLQSYSLKVFESGMKQRWMNLLAFEDMKALKKRETNAREGSLLNLDDILAAFYCLGIGLVLALISFTLEMFWHDCLHRLKWNMITGPIRKLCRPRKRRNRVPAYRFIQVQPRV